MSSLIDIGLRLFAQRNLVCAGLVLAFAAHLSAVQAGDASSDAKPEAARTLTHADNGGRVTIANGLYLALRLPVTPGTGYRWIRVVVSAPQLTQVGRIRFEPIDDRERVGAPEVQVFLFRATVSGETALVLEHKRPWEKEEPALEKFRVTIVIE